MPTTNKLDDVSSEGSYMIAIKKDDESSYYRGITDLSDSKMAKVFVDGSEEFNKLNTFNTQGSNVLEKA